MALLSVAVFSIVGIVSAFPADFNNGAMQSRIPQITFPAGFPLHLQMKIQQDMFNHGIGEQTFCAQDVMQCPNGDFVGRTGPQCEFVCE